jgi:hypothetical protein
LNIRYGVVASVDAAAGTVSVTVGGVPGGALPVLSSYSDPLVGDRVLILVGGGAPVVVGAVGDERAPRGIVKRGYNTVNSSPWNSTTQVVVQTLSGVPMVAGRAYTITSSCHVGNAGAANTAGDFVVMRHRIASTAKSAHSFVTTSAIDGLAPDCFTYVTEIDDASTGSHTVDLTGSNLAGGGSHRILAASGDRCFIKVTDEGVVNP